MTTNKKRLGIKKHWKEGGDWDLTLKFKTYKYLTQFQKWLEQSPQGQAPPLPQKGEIAEVENKLRENLHVVSHPIRYKILKKMLEKEEKSE